MRCTPQREQAVRLMAMRALGNSSPRVAVAQFFYVSERMLCAWIRAFNADRINVLLDKKRTGRPRVLDATHFFLASFDRRAYLLMACCESSLTSRLQRKLNLTHALFSPSLSFFA